MSFKRNWVRGCGVVLVATAVVDVVRGELKLAVLCALGLAFALHADATLGALQAVKDQSRRHDRAEAALEDLSARVARLEQHGTAGPDREEGEGNDR